MMSRLANLCALLWVLGGWGAMAPAQDAPAAQPAPAAPAASESAAAPATPEADAPAPASGGALSADFGFDFDRLAGDTIEYTPDGGLKMNGNVVFKSAQLNLESRDLVLNQEAKTLVANGSPVKIVQGDVTAECRNFFYNIDKKQSKLTGSPIINQKNSDGSITQIKNGATVIITQPADGGRPSVSVTGGTPEIVKLKPNDKPKAAAKPAARKATQNPELIKLPAVE